MPMHTITFRVTSEESKLLYEVVRQMRLNHKRYGRFTASDFIREAVAEKIDHIERGRKSSRRRTKRNEESIGDMALPFVAKILAGEGTLMPIDMEGMS